MALKEVSFEKIYDAPLDKVWQAWTDPSMLKQWWGPSNVIIPECEVDLKVGGRFYIVMEAGEAMGPYKGTRWPMEGKFTVVEPKSSLAWSAKAWTEGQEEGTMIDQTTQVSMEDAGGKTKVKVVAAITNAGPMAQMAVQGMQQGFIEQLEKLVGFLAKK